MKGNKMNRRDFIDTAVAATAGVAASGLMPVLGSSMGEKVLENTVKCDQQNQPVRVSTVNPNYFEYSSGEPYIPIGPNICFERYETDEEKVLQLYDRRFRNLSENRGNYTRIWLSAPFFEVEHTKAFTYDEAVARRIDRILEMAGKYGIKVKFCFENFRKLTGYPAPIFGSVPFEKPIYAVENGGPLETMDDYFNTREGRELFTGKIRYFADRYADHPAVFGWELWNEINAVSVSDPQITLRWTVDMLPIVKSAFPNHLVMQSLGSFDSRSYIEGMYRPYMTIPTNEVAQVHRYLDPGASWEICQAPMDLLAGNAVGEIRKLVTGKPVVLSEVGAVERGHSGPSKLYDLDTLGILLHDLLFAPFFSGAAGPGQSWHWQLYIEKNDLWWHFHRFANAVEGINPITENYSPFFLLFDNVRIYGLKGETNTLIWCRDMLSNWQTELIEQRVPDNRNIVLPLSQLNPPHHINTIRFYDPWKDLWVTTKSEDTLSFDLNRSIVIRLENK